MPHFLFTVCQRGAEPALKREIGRLWPEFRFAYSRPGFVTFKLPDDARLAEDFDLQSVFARTYGFSLGRVEGTDAQAMARDVWRLVQESEDLAARRTELPVRHSPEVAEPGAADEEPEAMRDEPMAEEATAEPSSHPLFPRLHVWERDAAEPGEHGFEPGVSPLGEEVGHWIAAAAGETPPQVNRLAKAGQRVLDVVLVEPNQWWVGWHRASAPPSRWPGGVCPVEPPEDVVSRAYLKMAEALAWSRLPLEPGDVCVEIGSAPGGSCQTLLDRGCVVTGIDPAEMATEVVDRENFTHVRARSKDLKRREFRGIPWLMADLNVAPNYTLETVESIVTHKATSFRGLILTLKLLEWELAEHIPEYLERIRGWGFEYVRARQLSYNRQEICVAALRRRQMRRKPFWREGQSKAP